MMWIEGSRAGLYKSTRKKTFLQNVGIKEKQKHAIIQQLNGVRKSSPPPSTNCEVSDHNTVLEEVVIQKGRILSAHSNKWSK